MIGSGVIWCIAFQTDQRSGLPDHDAVPGLGPSPPVFDHFLVMESGAGATGGVEVSGGSYVRQAVTFDAPAAGSMANSADVVFPQATATWGSIVGFGLYDAASGGNLLYFNNLTANKQIDSGDQFKFPAGSVTVTEQ